MGVGIYGSLFLRKETNVVGHVLIHPHAKYAFLIMKFIVLAGCICLPFVFTGDNSCGAISEADLDNKMNLKIQFGRVAVAERGRDLLLQPLLKYSFLS